MTRPLTPEQVLAIADTYCGRFPARVRSFPALAAAAAVPGARFHGVAVHDSPSAAADALQDAVERLEPLTGRNKQFARLCAQVYRRLAED